MNKEIKKKDLENFRTEINSLRKSLLNFRFQKSTGQLEKTSELRKTRRKIASIKTKLIQNRGKNNA